MWHAYRGSDRTLDLGKVPADARRGVVTTTRRAPGFTALALALALALLFGPGVAVADRVGWDRHADFTVIEGRNGDLFADLEFVNFCGWRHGQFETALRELHRLAGLISASGRRVVFTIAPGKGLIVRENVPWSQVPRATCARRGMWEQARLLDEFDSPYYVPLRKALETDDRQTYWKTDGHWTTVGATHWTTQLARELDPGLARRQHYTLGTSTEVGYLNVILGDQTPETVSTAEYAGPVQVTTAPDSAEDLSPTSRSPVDHSWSSRPGRHSWPGNTLLLADSFTILALGTLRPLFRDGRFLWVGNVANDVIADAVGDADTVVIEVAQFFAYDSPLTRRPLRSAVRRELARR